MAQAGHGPADPVESCYYTAPMSTWAHRPSDPRWRCGERLRDHSPWAGHLACPAAGRRHDAARRDPAGLRGRILADHTAHPVPGICSRGAPSARAARAFSVPAPTVPWPWGLPAAGQGDAWPEGEHRNHVLRLTAPAGPPDGPGTP